MGKLTNINTDDAKVTSNILAPLTGQLMPVSQVPDSTFANGFLGDGIAITPTTGMAIAPASGVIRALFPTKHAVLIQADCGAEILIHIGLDTVHLNGDHFTSHVKRGDVVQQGDLLIEFDIEAIKKHGFNLISPILICNMSENLKLHTTDADTVDFNQFLMSLEFTNSEQ